jgi:hypothetical protein
MIERAKKAFAEGKLLEEFCPVPKDLHVVAGRVGSDEDPEQIKLEEDTARNIATHGYANWYDYCVNEWGTKWDVGGDGDQASQDSPTDLRMNFDSAWAPPTEAYAKLMEQGFEILAYYYEPGMNFVGKWDENGDDCYEIPETVEAIEEVIPSDIEQCFNLIENLIQWQEENQDGNE